MEVGDERKCTTIVEDTLKPLNVANGQLAADFDFPLARLGGIDWPNFGRFRKMRNCADTLKLVRLPLIKNDHIVLPKSLGNDLERIQLDKQFPRYNATVSNVAENGGAPLNVEALFAAKAHALAMKEEMDAADNVPIRKQVAAALAPLRFAPVANCTAHNVGAASASSDGGVEWSVLPQAIGADAPSAASGVCIDAPTPTKSLAKVENEFKPAIPFELIEE